MDYICIYIYSYICEPAVAGKVWDCLIWIPMEKKKIKKTFEECIRCLGCSLNDGMSQIRDNSPKNPNNLKCMHLMDVNIKCVCVCVYKCIYVSRFIGKENTVAAVQCSFFLPH